MRLLPVLLMPSLLTAQLCLPARANPIMDALLGGSIAPLAPAALDGTSTHACHKAKSTLAARVTGSNIDSDDREAIAFTEYYVDWSQWMSEVSDVWAQSFAADAKSTKLHCLHDATVEFTCQSDGTIDQVAVRHSSGDADCDRLQVESLLRCGRLPHFPAGARAGVVTFLYVWQYKSSAASAKQNHPRVVPNGGKPEEITISGQQM